MDREAGREEIRSPADDPRPQPPREPSPEECCGGGCTPCVYDRYADALERYRERLQAWSERHPGAAATDGLS